jgi:N-acetylglucosamine-6-phosphate deacetylase
MPDQAVRNLMAFAGLPFERAIVSATYTPARLIGLERELGSIARGNRADLSIWSADHEVIATLVGGVPVFGAQAFAATEQKVT